MPKRASFSSSARYSQLSGRPRFSRASQRPPQRIASVPPGRAQPGIRLQLCQSTAGMVPAIAPVASPTSSAISSSLTVRPRNTAGSRFSRSGRKGMVLMAYRMSEAWLSSQMVITRRTAPTPAIAPKSFHCLRPPWISE